MLKKRIKIKNSTVLFIGLLFIIMGVGAGFFELFIEKRSKVFSEMNIRLYKNEIPNNIRDIDVVEQKKELNEGQESDMQKKDPNINKESETQKPDPIKQPEYDYIGILEIPKINLKRGFLDLNSKYNDVKYNITLINGSTYPNEENNNLIFAAHSGNCSVCFFNKLFDLSINDEASIYYDNKIHRYKLTKTYEVEKTGKVTIYRDPYKNVLTLITCTKNSDTKQTVFIFELA